MRLDIKMYTELWRYVQSMFMELLPGVDSCWTLGIV